MSVPRPRFRAIQQLWRRMSQRKPLPLSEVHDSSALTEQSKMKNVLGLLDLTLLGVGATLGTGVYVLAGRTASEDAGPAVVVSFLIAAVASLLAALCYAELASVMPGAGTAYTYSYFGIGEFPAFIVGWNLLLEYAIATASVARAFSDYVDAVTGHHIETWSLRSVPLEGPFLAHYPGFLAVGFISILAVLLALGVRESAVVNGVCTFLNLVTIVITIVAGACKSDPANWSIPPEDIPPGAGTGGFVPFGVRGVLAGAAKCFFAYVGFDTITACGEEAKNPKRTIPLSIMLTLVIIFFTYMAVSIVATMMVPYYDQDIKMPFPSAFEKAGLPTISGIVTFGAMFAMGTSLLGSMFPLPRVLLTMATDGMLFRCLGKVCAATGTSLLCTALAWLMSGSMALLFDLDQLIDMMSIGTLTAYVVVAVSVVQIRYRGHGIASKEQRLTASHILKAIFNYERIQLPSALSSWVVTSAQLLFLSLCIPASYLLARLDELQTDTPKQAWLSALLVLIFLVTLCIARQPCAQVFNNASSAFRVLCVPFLPYLSILINMSLMMMMNWETWARFSTWLLIGLALYFCYSISHSSLAQSLLESKPPSSSRGDNFGGKN